MLNAPYDPELHARIPVTALSPWKLSGLLGPSVTAPSWMSPCPVSDPARFAISLCMQCGYTEPAPTTKEEPHALPPRAKSSCRCANAWYCADPPYWRYRALVTHNPNACGAASEAPSWVPRPNGSPAASASAVCSCVPRSLSSSRGEITGGMPARWACRTARSSSASATAPESYRFSVSPSAGWPWAM